MNRQHQFSGFKWQNGVLSWGSQQYLEFSLNSLDDCSVGTTASIPTPRVASYWRSYEKHHTSYCFPPNGSTCHLLPLLANKISCSIFTPCRQEVSFYARRNLWWFFVVVGQNFNCRDSLHCAVFSCLLELISSELFPPASVILDFWVIVCPFLICQIDIILTILYFLPNTPLICEVPCMEMPNPDFLCDLLKV